jgi:hypothetical protein
MPKDQPSACPILSFMKANPQICRGSLCSWWVHILPSNGPPVKGCAISLIANFFAQRLFEAR